MNGPITTPPDAASEARWMAWKAEGAASDRRGAATMRWLFIAVAAIIVALFVMAVL